MNDLKILALDIEVHPAAVLTYDLWQPIIKHTQILRPSEIICFSYQWYGERAVRFVSEWDEGGPDEMHQLLQTLLTDADVVLGYNTVKYDIPWITGELAARGITAPAPVKHIDLYQTFRSKSRYLSRKLDYVAYRVMGDRKIDVNTLTLAVECRSEDPDVSRRARNKMSRYSKQDVRLLFPLFEAVRSYVKMPHPISGGYACHACGSESLQRRGTAKTLTGSYQRFVCNDCGSWFRGTKRESASEIRAL